MKYLIIILFSLSVQVHALTPITQEGEDLYLEANCQKCHNKGSSFDAKQHKAKSLFELKGWVSSCAGFFDISWFPEDEKKVLHYLNQEFYHYQ